MKTLTIATSLGLLAQLALATGAGAAAARYDYASGTDFSKYTSYAWDAGARPSANELAERRLRSALDAELAAKGLDATTGHADLIARYQVSVDRELRIDDSFRGPFFGRQLDVDTYEQGTLVLDLIDARSGELIWRGSVSKALPEGQTDPEKQSKKIEKAVSQLLANFPPPTSN